MIIIRLQWIYIDIQMNSTNTLRSCKITNSIENEILYKCENVQYQSLPVWTTGLRRLKQNLQGCLVNFFLEAPLMSLYFPTVYSYSDIRKTKMQMMCTAYCWRGAGWPFLCIHCSLFFFFIMELLYNVMSSNNNIHPLSEAICMCFFPKQYSAFIVWCFIPGIHKCQTSSIRITWMY